MPWIAAHPDNTMTIRLPEEAPREEQGEFTLGYWPPRLAEKFSRTLSELSDPDRKLDPVEDQKQYLESINLDFDLAMEMVAYGVRGWDGVEDASGNPIVPGRVERTFDGRKFEALDEGSLEFLYTNRMIGVLALKCQLFNYLTDEEKKRSALQSGLSSSTRPTNAKGAEASPTQTESSDSTANLSRAALTG